MSDFPKGGEVMERDREGTPVLNTNEARQGNRKTGNYWALIGGLLLALIAAAFVWLYFGSLPR